MNVRSSNNVSCYPVPSEVDSNHGNPCSLVENFLFPNVGNSPARTSSGAGSEALALPEAGIWTTSLHFPCRSGISVQRRVGDRLRRPPFRPRPQFISVASKTRWCRIRLSERSERVESLSLRHSVCCCRDFARSSTNSLGNSRDSAGFWRIRSRFALVLVSMKRRHLPVRARAR